MKDKRFETSIYTPPSCYLTVFVLKAQNVLECIKISAQYPKLCLLMPAYQKIW